MMMGFWLPALGTPSQTSKQESGHDGGGSGEGENLDDFQTLEHLAYLEHTEYRAPTRNIGWGEQEEDKEILRQIFDEMNVETTTELGSKDKDFSDKTKQMATGRPTELTSEVFSDFAAETTIKSAPVAGSEEQNRPTGPFNDWQGRVHFETKELPSPTDVDEKEYQEEPTQRSSNDDSWRIRFEVERPQSNEAVGSPELGGTDPKSKSPEFEVTNQNTGKGSSTTFPSSIEIFETMPPCDTEFCEWFQKIMKKQIKLEYKS